MFGVAGFLDIYTSTSGCAKEKITLALNRHDFMYDGEQSCPVFKLVSDIILMII